MIKNSRTWQIHLSGLVQGVGFRPFIFNLAKKHGLKGWVNNDLDGLHIVFNSTQDFAFKFYNNIKANPPSLARITSSSLAEIDNQEFQKFDIIHKTNSQKPRLFLTPDFATCQNCSSELSSYTDRRFNYPFITCSECGPRYSIIQSLPYDRENTAMDYFKMCNKCRAEYSNPHDRRYYSQTNSCHTCGISIQLFKSQTESISIDNESFTGQIVNYWNEGKIIAIKGIGGYLITCDGSNSEVISRLRKRKKRPDKPLALMYPDLNSLAEYKLSEKEKEELLSPTSPIILVKKNGETKISDGICDELSRVGIMLPYAPIFQSLLHSFGRPIVATSGNISNSPLIYSDDIALEHLFEIVDLVLAHDRKIVIPQDDSVVTYSKYFNKKVILRRSRGMAPSYHNQNLVLSNKSWLSMGAQLKTTFSILHHENMYVSQYLGDLESYDTEESYRNTLEHLKDLLDVNPDLVLVDFHPNYRSTIIGEEIAKTHNIPLVKIQHHIAHFSALLGEHDCLSNDEKILGVIWDGTGLGTDQNIWGSEFFLYKNFEFDRVDHLPYFSHIAGDKISKEPRLSALSLCQNIQNADPLLKQKFTKQEWRLFNQMLGRNNTLKTSSMGRLFDGIASLLGILDIQTYEGQAASLLQVKAEEFFDKYGLEFDESYYHPIDHESFSLSTLIQRILSDIQSEKAVEFIAAKFHISLISWIRHVAKRENVKKIGFSGGVFQNTLLVDLIISKLSSQFELLFHKELSPNDENISFGQIIYGEIQSKRGDYSVT